MTSDPLRIDFPGLEDSAGSEEKGIRGRRGRKGRSETGKRRGARYHVAKGLIWATGILLLLLLPFYALIRTSVFLFQAYGLSGWAALAGGAIATVLLLILYMVLVSLRVGGKGRVPKALRRGTALLVMAYCVYALVYLSSANAKTEEIRATYSDLHPILRVAVSTLLLADRDGVLTDTGRTTADYEEWGMAVNENSLHLPQEDGFVYAVDVRTVGRPEWQNKAVRVYFRSLGFQTLRHVGTADHLHVELPPA
jgi:hypothetical protein